MSATFKDDYKRAVQPNPGGDTPENRAAELHDTLIGKALNGTPQVCSYAYAHRHIFNAPYNNDWKPVIAVALATLPHELQVIGAVRLDAFIVNGNTKLPGRGHWRTAEYDREDWETVLGTAELLQ